MQHIDAGINLLRQRYQHHPEWFRSDRPCFLDAVFSTLWRSHYQNFKDNGPLPPGAFDLHLGVQPEFCQSNKIWGIHVDDIYSSLHIKGNHWVAMMISVHTRHIVLWDSIVGHARAAEVEDAVKPICDMMAYLMNLLAPAEEKHLHPNVPYTYEQKSKAEVPQNIVSGDCGVYCLKYIECHLLGMPFPPTLLCDSNIKNIREKLAVDIYNDLGIKGTEKRDYSGLDIYDETRQ